MPSINNQLNDILDAVHVSSSDSALIRAEELIERAHAEASISRLQYLTLRAKVNGILDAWNVPA